jgi:hypothetical protein
LDSAECKQFVSSLALITPRGPELYGVFWLFIFRGMVAAFPVAA